MSIYHLSIIVSFSNGVWHRQVSETIFRESRILRDWTSSALVHQVRFSLRSPSVPEHLHLPLRAEPDRASIERMRIE